MTILIFLVVLSVLVVAHEAGHFYFAKRFGVRVDEFALGFPPKVKKLFRYKNTDFVLNLLPFGGYVKIFGENPGESIEESVSPNESGKGISFTELSRVKQVIVLFGGVLANFILAWVLLSLVLIFGIQSEGVFIQDGFFGAMVNGFLTALKIVGLIVVALGDLFKALILGGGDFSSLVGPVGLVSVVGEVSRDGFVPLMYFTALISLNLAVINLVPLPALDGGRILITFIEGVRKKAISPKVFDFVNKASFFLLILLMVWITIRDVSRLL